MIHYNLKNAIERPIANRCTDLPSRKVLRLNGYSAIQCCTCTDPVQSFMFIEENMLVFVIEGILKLRFGKEEYTIARNQMVFLKKEIRIEYSANIQSNGPAQVKYITVCLKHDLVKEFVKLAQLNIKSTDDTLPVTVNSVDKPLLTFIESLQHYFVDSENVDGPLTKIKLLELLFNLSRFNNKVMTQLMDLRQQFRTDITATVEDNIMNSLSLNQLAVLSGRSLSSFRRDFLAIYNMPPSQWIRQRRLDKATELLQHTTMTITDVCYTLGFENLAHFSRLFKSYFGHSPSEFKLTALAA